MNGKVLVLNPFLYTTEGREKVKTSIDDTLVITLCKAFQEIGWQPTLIADCRFKPIEEKDYGFEIIYLDSYCRKLFSPIRFPFPKGLLTFIRKNKSQYDIIISSEVFSLYSLISRLACPKKTVIWHELAMHNRMWHGYASRIWYNVIGRLLLRNTRIAPRTKRAQAFISKYCNNVSAAIFDHGVDFDKFAFESRPKENWLISVSQLIKRKNVDKIISVYAEFVRSNPGYKLFICGEGEEESSLKKQVVDAGISDNVCFTGNLSHRELMKIWPYCKALLIYTSKDNSMMTIPESVVCETPIITTSVPDCSYYIEDNSLGIVKDNWGCDDLSRVVKEVDKYRSNCKQYKDNLAATAIAQRFIDYYVKK